MTIEPLAVGLTEELFCVTPDTTEDQVVKFINGQKMIPATDHQVKQRLFGGIPCDSIKGNIHIFHAAGRYTYTGPNGDLLPEERQEIWQGVLKRMREFVPDFAFDKSTIFAADAPEN